MTAEAIVLILICMIIGCGILAWVTLPKNSADAYADSMAMMGINPIKTERPEDRPAPVRPPKRR